MGRLCRAGSNPGQAAPAGSHPARRPQPFPAGADGGGRAQLLQRGKAGCCWGAADHAAQAFIHGTDQDAFDGCRQQRPRGLTACIAVDEPRPPEGRTMLSVVVPIYNEEENVVAFHAAVEAVLGHIEEETGEKWEVVYVNDGSRDSSLSLLLEIQERIPRVVVVELTRNFGHQAALTAGLQVAKGDAVILMDGDFQDPPEVLPSLVNAWKKVAKVILAERSSRAETGIRGKLFPLFYKAMSWLSDFPIPLHAGIFGLLDRQAADAIHGLQEANRDLPGMRAWIGFPTAVTGSDRGRRALGETQ